MCFGAQALACNRILPAALPGADVAKLEAAAAAGGKAAASKAVARSDSVLVVKNLPFSASEAELEALFGAIGERAGAAGCCWVPAPAAQLGDSRRARLLGVPPCRWSPCPGACCPPCPNPWHQMFARLPAHPAGPLGRLVLPPTRTLALVEYLEPQVGCPG